MPRARAKLRSMASSQSFRDYVLDQVSAIPKVRAKAMFGGIGIYSGEVFFGIIASDVLYLKVDDSNRAQYEHAGSAAFVPYPNKASMTMPYYNVPVGVLEQADDLTEWATMSIAVAKNKKPKKTATKKATKRRAGK
jgi:DNA transformation protein